MTSNRSATKGESSASPASPHGPHAVLDGCRDRVAERRRQAVAFVRAAVALAQACHDHEDQARLATEAGQALVRLGDLGARDALAEALRPDPAEEEVAWTVACYQIGDLVPCSLRDFTDPTQALEALARCEEASHVAGELLASSPAGLRWSVLVRTGDQVSYQPLTQESASAASTTSPASLERALEHWAARLGEWAALAEEAEHGATLLGIGPEPDRGPVVEGGSETLLAALVATVRSIEARLAARDDLLVAVEGRLEAIERRLARIERGSGKTPPGRHGRGSLVRASKGGLVAEPRPDAST